MKSLFFSLLLSTSLIAQLNVDSLKQIIDEKGLNEKVKILSDISSYYMNRGYLDSSSLFAEKILKLAEQNNDDTIKSTAYFKMAAPLIFDEKFDSALVYLGLSYDFAEKIGSKKFIARIFANRGIIYSSIGMQLKAIEELNNSIELFKEFKDSLKIAVTYGNIAHIYFNMGYYETSTEYTLKSLEFSKMIDDKVGIGFMQRQMGNNLRQIGKYEDALRRYDSAIEIFESEDETREMANTYAYVAEIYKKQKNYDAAERFLIKANNLYTKYNIQAGKISVLEHYSEIFIVKKEYLKALEYETKILDYYKQNRLKHELVESYLRLADINSNLGNRKAAEDYFKKTEAHIDSLTSLTMLEELYKTKAEYYCKYEKYKLAYINHQKLLAIKDSILSKEISSQINDMQIKYSSLEKQKENDLLLAKNRLQQKEVEEQILIRNNIYIFIAVLAIFGLVLIVRYLKTLKLSKELNKANATLNKFFSIISHDLKNLFYGQLGYTDLVVSDLDNLSREELHGHMVTIQNTVKKSFVFTENLFKWSMAQQNKIDLNPEKIEIENLVNEVVELYKNSAASKNILLVKNIESNFSFYSDLETIKTVIRNLTNNAIKFSKENGVIKLSAEKVNGNVNITVEDNGVGIHSENIPYLFSIEKNISTEGTAKEKGSGLGLILCKEFIEKNKGSINVESEVGKGSKFIITLPA